MPKMRPAMTDEQEKEAIREALERCHGSITPAANMLGMSRATFWRKRKLYGV
jgi:two-component system response regulator AtoC